MLYKKKNFVLLFASTSLALISGENITSNKLHASGGHEPTSYYTGQYNSYLAVRGTVGKMSTNRLRSKISSPGMALYCLPREVTPAKKGTIDTQAKLMCFIKRKKFLALILFTLLCLTTLTLREQLLAREAKKHTTGVSNLNAYIDQEPPTPRNNLDQSSQFGLTAANSLEASRNQTHLLKALYNKRTPNTQRQSFITGTLQNAPKRFPIARTCFASIVQGYIARPSFIPVPAGILASAAFERAQSVQVTLFKMCTLSLGSVNTTGFLKSSFFSLPIHSLLLAPFTKQLKHKKLRNIFSKLAHRIEKKRKVLSDIPRLPEKKGYSRLQKLADSISADIRKSYGDIDRSISRLGLKNTDDPVVQNLIKLMILASMRIQPSLQRSKLFVLQYKSTGSIYGQSPSNSHDELVQESKKLVEALGAFVYALSGQRAKAYPGPVNQYPTTNTPGKPHIDLGEGGGNSDEAPIGSGGNDAPSGSGRNNKPGGGGNGRSGGNKNTKDREQDGKRNNLINLLNAFLSSLRRFRAGVVALRNAGAPPELLFHSFFFEPVITELSALNEAIGNFYGSPDEVAVQILLTQLMHCLENHSDYDNLIAVVAEVEAYVDSYIRELLSELSKRPQPAPASNIPDSSGRDNKVQSNKPKAAEQNPASTSTCEIIRRYMHELKRIVDRIIGLRGRLNGQAKTNQVGNILATLEDLNKSVQKHLSELKRKVTTSDVSASTELQHLLKILEALKSQIESMCNTVSDPLSLATEDAQRLALVRSLYISMDKALVEVYSLLMTLTLIKEVGLNQSAKEILKAIQNERNQEREWDRGPCHGINAALVRLARRVQGLLANSGASGSDRLPIGEPPVLPPVNFSEDNIESNIEQLIQRQAAQAEARRKAEQEERRRQRLLAERTRASAEGKPARLRAQEDPDNLGAPTSSSPSSPTQPNAIDVPSGPDNSSEAHVAGDGHNTINPFRSLLLALLHRLRRLNWCASGPREADDRDRNPNSDDGPDPDDSSGGPAGPGRSSRSTVDRGR
jgi:hypothetical protein